MRHFLLKASSLCLQPCSSIKAQHRHCRRRYADSLYVVFKVQQLREVIFFSKRNEDYMNKKAKNEIPRGGEKLSRQSKTMSRNDKNIIDSLLEWNLIHLLEDIFLHLDVQSLTNAEQAFPDSWRPFIQGNSKLYHKKLATISSWFLRSSIKTSSVGNSKKKEKSQSRRNPLFRQPLGTTLMAAPTLFQE